MLHGHTETPVTGEGPYLKPKQPSKEVGAQVADDNVEGDAGPKHQPDHAAEKGVGVVRALGGGLWSRPSAVPPLRTSVDRLHSWS